jgi:hypothetical protein
MNKTPQTHASIRTRIGDLHFTQDFANGYPTPETVAKIYDERDFQRACQAYLWALPIVSFAEWQHAARTVFGAGDTDVVVYTSYVDKLGILTANATTPYFLSMPDLAKTGPLVIEIPAGATAGGVNDFWQRPVTDMGLPGPDRGKGGKYVIVGPGQDAPQGDEFIVVRSSTMNLLMGFRNLETDPERAANVYRLYPLAKRNDPPSTRYIEVDGRAWTGQQPRGLAYWERLADILKREPVQERDRIMMAMLRSIGIEKGKAFAPDERLTAVLTEAVLIGEAMARANDFDKRDMELTHYADGVQWHFSLCLDPSQETEHYTQLDERAAWFYEAVTTTKGMVTKTPGVGSTYLGTYKDGDGEWLDGANTYRLRVPANAPVKQFWSLTVYDVDTRCLIRNSQQIADRSSYEPDLVKNADGAVDLYVGPKAPAGFESNWIPSVPGKAWFCYFRLYAPTEPHFDGEWVLPDFERVG